MATSGFDPAALAAAQAATAALGQNSQFNPNAFQNTTPQQQYNPSQGQNFDPNNLQGMMQNLSTNEPPKPQSPPQQQQQQQQQFINQTIPQQPQDFSQQSSPQPPVQPNLQDPNQQFQATNQQYNSPNPQNPNPNPQFQQQQNPNPQFQQQQNPQEVPNQQFQQQNQNPQVPDQQFQQQQNPNPQVPNPQVPDQQFQQQQNPNPQVPNPQVPNQQFQQQQSQNPQVPNQQQQSQNPQVPNQQQQSQNPQVPNQQFQQQQNPNPQVPNQQYQSPVPVGQNPGGVHQSVAPNYATGAAGAAGIGGAYASAPVGAAAAGYSPQVNQYGSLPANINSVLTRPSGPVAAPPKQMTIKDVVYENIVLEVPAQATHGTGDNGAPIMFAYVEIKYKDPATGRVGPIMVTTGRVLSPFGISCFNGKKGPDGKIVPNADPNKQPKHTIGLVLPTDEVQDWINFTLAIAAKLKQYINDIKKILPKFSISLGVDQDDGKTRLEWGAMHEFVKFPDKVDRNTGQLYPPFINAKLFTPGTSIKKNAPISVTKFFPGYATGKATNDEIAAYNNNPFDTQVRSGAFIPWNILKGVELDVKSTLLISSIFVPNGGGKAAIGVVASPVVVYGRRPRSYADDAHAEREEFAITNPDEAESLRGNLMDAMAGMSRVDQNGGFQSGSANFSNNSIGGAPPPNPGMSSSYNITDLANQAAMAQMQASQMFNGGGMQGFTEQ